MDDPALITGELPNGIRYYIRENRNPANRAELRLVVNAGSVLEDDDQRGIAHFVEHMAFNGTRSFEKHELVDYLQSVGLRFGQDLNATTSFEETTYRLTLPTDTAAVLEQGIRILEEWAHEISFDSAEVVAERAVVLAEMQARYGNRAPALPNSMALLLEGTPYEERLPIGNRETIAAAEPEVLRRFYRDWYRPDLIAIVAVGDFDRFRIEQLITERFSRIPKPRDARQRPVTPPLERTEAGVSIVTEARMGPAKVQVHTLARTASGMEAYQDELTEQLFDTLLNRRLHDAARASEGTFASARVSRRRITYSTHASVLEVTTEREADRALRAVLAEVERVARHGFVEAEVEREKALWIRRLERRAVHEPTPSDDLAQRYVSHYLDGGRTRLHGLQQELALAQSVLPQISREDLMRRAEAWRGAANQVVNVQVPRGFFAGAPRKDAVLAAFDDMAEMEVTAYAGSTSGTPLMTNLPSPVGVAGELRYDAADVSEWALPNGARVLFKPAVGEPGRLDIFGFRAGGVSAAPDSMYVSALVAADLVAAGGVGDVGADELHRRLAGTTAYATVDIADYEETVRAGGSVSDAELIFQLLHLRLTEPRLDSAAIARWKDGVRNQLPARRDSAMTRGLLTQSHPRARPLTSAMLDSIDVAEALSFYNERLGDASDFNFIVAGAIDHETVLPLVEQYMATLPGSDSGTVEGWRDHGVRPPGGVRQFRLGSSATRMIFTGTHAVAPIDQLELRALTALLRMRLTTRLREQLGGTYSVNVYSSSHMLPYDGYELTIRFSAPPNRVDELSRATLAVIDSLQRSGPTAVELQQVLEMERRAYESSLGKNATWLSLLSDHVRGGWSLESAGDIESLLSQLTPGRLKRAAVEYLNRQRYLQIS